VPVVQRLLIDLGMECWELAMSNCGGKRASGQRWMTNIGIFLIVIAYTARLCEGWKLPECKVRSYHTYVIGACGMI
jgi:hypothetical protein